MCVNKMALLYWRMVLLMRITPTDCKIKSLRTIRHLNFPWSFMKIHRMIEQGQYKSLPTVPSSQTTQSHTL